MADEADYTPTGVATDSPVEKQEPETRHPDAFVESVDDKARESGDPYFSEYADDPDDNRASAGVREPRPIDRPTAKQLGVEFNG